MNSKLVPAELLKKCDKILFVAHLALGDFTYMQNCFRAFSQAYPHIKIHLWVDELRRTPKKEQWEHLSKYALYDWVNASPFFEKIYCQTYSPQLFKQSIAQAKLENYPVVVSLAVHHRHRYVNLIRKISPNGFIVGQKKRVRLLDIRKHYIYSKLDAFIPAYKITREHQSGEEAIPHISTIYANWFNQLFGITIPDTDLFPYVDIPEQWRSYANQQIIDWQFNHGEKIVFLNGFSKSAERTWSLKKVVELATEMKKLDKWKNANFIVNVIPECLPEAKQLISDFPSTNIQLFSAEENFFQLPAILSLCHLIVSVETAVMHLANAVHVPVIALMRQTSPEWTPINAAITTIVKVAERKAWVDEITIPQVIAVLP